MRSILNFGEVLILTEWDTASQADLHLEYIVRPETVEWLLNELKETKQKEIKEEIQKNKTDFIESIKQNSSINLEPKWI